MKAHPLFIKSIVFIGVALSCISLHGRTPGRTYPKTLEELVEIRREIISSVDLLPAIQNEEEEAALLEELKGYIQGEDNPDNDSRLSGVIQVLTDFGGTDTIQFFLDNIAWAPRADWPMTFDTTSPGPPPPIPARPLFSALHEMNVPLQQCIDTMLREEEWTIQFQRIMYFTFRIHGEDFIREADAVAEALPDTDPRKFYWLMLAKVAYNTDDEQRAANMESITSKYAPKNKPLTWDAELPPSDIEPPTPDDIIEEEIPSVIEVEEGATTSHPNRPWLVLLGGLVTLGLCAMVYVVWRKKQR